MKICSTYSAVVFGALCSVASICTAAEPASIGSNATFVAFDTETTGVAAARDRIVEIGAVKFRGGAVLEYRSWLINPGTPIPKAAQLIHGITDEMVARQPGFSAVAAEFFAFVDGCVLFAHNARFDAGFLAAEAHRANLEPPSLAIVDSLALCRNWYPDRKSYSLDTLCKDLAIPKPHLHRAMSDADCVRQVVLKAAEAGWPVDFDTAGRTPKAVVTVSPRP